MITATAAVLSGYHQPFEIAEVELDDLRRDEVLVRIVATGLCHTDLSVRSQVTPFPLPGVIGHEGAGVVEAVGDRVTSVQAGDHVVLSFASCGQCRSCRTGHPAYCVQWPVLNLFGGARPDGTTTIRRNGKDLHGHFFGQSSFATHAIAPERSVVPVPKDVDLALLGPLACGVQTGVQSVLNVLRPMPGSTLAVYGAGAVGLSALLAARNVTAATTYVVDINPDRLSIAKRLGAAATIDSSKRDPVEALRELTGGAGVDNALETSGIPAVLRQAVDSLAPLGSAGVIGAPALGAEVALPVLDFIAKGTRVVGINQGDAIPRESIPAMVELFQQGRLPFDQLLAFYELADIGRAVDDMASGQVVKPVIRLPVGS